MFLAFAMSDFVVVLRLPPSWFVPNPLFHQQGELFSMNHALILVYNLVMKLSVLAALLRPRLYTGY